MAYQDNNVVPMEGAEFEYEGPTSDEPGQDDFEEFAEDSQLLEYLDAGNLAKDLDPKDNTEYADKAMELYGEAHRSMDDWRKKYDRALALASLQPQANGKDIKQKDFPFKNASLAMMPYITEACLDFNSRAAPELVWAKDIVKAKTYGKNSEEKEARAERVAQYQNYQLAEMIPSWRKNQDKGIFALPCVGTIYKETYFDSDLNEICSDLCKADEIVFDQSYDSFEEAQHVFKKIEYTRNEVIGFIRGGTDWVLDESDLDDTEEKFTFYECYTWVDMDDDGLTEPYCLTIFEDSQRIVHMVPYYDEESVHENSDGEIIRVDALKRFTQIQFLPDPIGGPMGMGWGILLGPMFESINTNVRQLIDAGTTANVAANSAYYAAGNVTNPSQGNGVQTGPVEARIAQITPIQVKGNLRDNLVQFPASGPNQTLMALMEYQVEAARRMTNAASQAEANPGEAATLYLARLHQTLKVPNSINMRVYEGMKCEMQKIGGLNYKHFDDKKYNRVIDQEQQASMQYDFNPDDCDIRLEADPSEGSDVERATRAQAILQEAKEDQSGTLNKRQAYIDWLETMKTPNIDALAPEPDPNAVDPTMQKILMQEAAEMEMKKKDQDLRAADLQLKQAKMAKEVAAEASKAGLMSEKQEADIALTYVKAMEIAINIGVTDDDNAIQFIENIEDRMIAKDDRNFDRQERMQAAQLAAKQAQTTV